jgi:hypothetical protein
MGICAIVAGLAFAGCSSAPAPDSAVQIRPVLQDGEVFTDFGWVTLLNNCGKRVTFVGITAPPTDDRSPGSISYQLRPANGELITVEVGSWASLPPFGRRLRVTGIPACVRTYYAVPPNSGMRETETAILREESRAEPDGERR